MQAAQPFDRGGERHGVLLEIAPRAVALAKPPEHVADVVAPRMHVARERFVPVERRGERCAGQGAQGVGRDGGLAVGIAQVIDEHAASAGRLALGGRQRVRVALRKQRRAVAGEGVHARVILRGRDRPHHVQAARAAGLYRVEQAEFIAQLPHRTGGGLDGGKVVAGAVGRIEIEHDPIRPSWRRGARKRDVELDSAGVGEPGEGLGIVGQDLREGTAPHRQARAPYP